MNELNVLGGTLRDAVGCHICACPSSSVAIPTMATVDLPGTIAECNLKRPKGHCKECTSIHT